MSLEAGDRLRSAGVGLDTTPSDGPARALPCLFVGLVLYAALGKGFAYAGWPPLFVGELLLVVVLVSAVRSSALLPRTTPAVVTAVLVGMAVVQFAVDRLAGTVPLLETVRGLAPVYYSGFAFGVYALLRDWEARTSRSHVLDTVGTAVARAVPLVSPVLLVLAALLLIEPAWLPRWPGSGVPLLLTKPGDIAVTLVLVASVMRPPRLGGLVVARRPLLVVMLSATALLVAARSRGALLTLIVGMLVARPRPDRIAKGLLAAVTVLLALYVSGLRIEVAHRELSYEAATDAIASLVGTESSDDIQGNYVGTRNWRTDWWEAIWSDATGDRMVLHGYGWGDNLAIRYGIAAPDAAEDPRVLRLPHSFFFSLVGRAGVVFAVAFVLVLLLTIGRTFRAGTGDRPSPLVEGARGALAAAVVTGLFGVYVESPQGGILVWNLVGFLWWATSAAREPRVVRAGPAPGAWRPHAGEVAMP